MCRKISQLNWPKDSVMSVDPAVLNEEDDYPSKLFRYRKPSTGWAEYIQPKVSHDLIPKPDNIIDSSVILRHLQRGIRYSFQSFPIVPERDLLMKDFSAIEVLEFSRHGPYFSECNYTFNVYAPNAFWAFRHLFGIQWEDFCNSVCDQPLCEVKVHGTSRSLFYKTYDDIFILKTTKKKEANFLSKLLPGYFLNLNQHSKTLLPKFYGMYSYHKGQSNVCFIIMNNLLPSNIKIHEKYDIKGSTYSKRKAKEVSEDLDSVTLKDLDIMESHPNGFFLKHCVYQNLKKSIARDCDVLESHNIMDFSVLLGVHFPDEALLVGRNLLDSSTAKDSSSKSKTNGNVIGPFEALTSNGKTAFLYVGIIDILQSYTFSKKIEHFFKSFRYSSSTISVQNPVFYSQRFQKFLETYVFKCVPKVVEKFRPRPNTTYENIVGGQ